MARISKCSHLYSFSLEASDNIKTWNDTVASSLLTDLSLLLTQYSSTLKSL